MMIPAAANTPEMQKKFDICNGCDTRDGIWCSKAKGGCGCIIVLKTKTTSKCPKDKW